MGPKTIAASLTLAALTAFSQTPPPTPAQPQSPPPSAKSNAARYAGSLQLGYVLTTSSDQNDKTKAGLEMLAAYLTKRASVQEPVGIVGVNPETIDKNELLLIPFLVWPVEQNAAPLSSQARQKMQDYSDRGNLILLDVKDLGASLSRGEALKKIPAGLAPKPLTELKDSHVLSKTFYLVSGLPGAKAFGSVWVAAPEAGEAEKISPYIIGNNNWADAWSGRTVGQNSETQKNALRAGVNMVFYALTGNYKADALHAPAILERLKR